MAASLRVAQIVPDTQAEGPGRRFAIWVQGCPILCPGCCNPLMLPEAGGEEMDAAALAERVIAQAGVEGVSFLGGEPMAQAAGKSVMVFSGWTLDELRATRDADVDGVLALADLLVDGRFERELPERRRRWIGSANQVMHFLTARYSPEDPQFTAPNTVEVRIVGGELMVNGWPAVASKLIPLKRGRAAT